MCNKTVLIVLAMMMMAAGAQADTVSLSGFLDDQANTALVWSDLGPPLFDVPENIANNVALYDITIPVAGSVEFQSLGFAAGGIDPYFTLFVGTGTLATFLGSNNVQAFSTGGDFDLIFGLPVGSYTVAIGAFANMSIAENYGGGVLGDGFSGTGNANLDRSWYYELGITTPGQTVPEPATWLLMLPAIAVIGITRRRSQEQRRYAASGRQRDSDSEAF